MRSTVWSIYFQFFLLLVFFVVSFVCLELADVLPFVLFALPLVHVFLTVALFLLMFFVLVLAFPCTCFFSSLVLFLFVFFHRFLLMFLFGFFGFLAYFPLLPCPSLLLFFVFLFFIFLVFAHVLLNSCFFSYSFSFPSSSFVFMFFFDLLLANQSFKLNKKTDHL